MNRWFPRIGLEIHAQLNTKSKLFSSAGKVFLGAPNSFVAGFDASMPGTMPTINRRCVELAVASSYALNCEISLKSSFDRKHYFYADMPQGFQITQHRAPIARNGYVDFLIEGNKMKRLRIEQVQLEQDSGKTLHDPVDNMSLIDLNRAGVGLIEVVTAPDLHSAADAHAFVREMLLILDYAGSCKGRMEEGEFRVDANVSVSRHPDEMGTRTEVKNINRFKGIQKAVDFEIKRQIEVLQSGGKVIQETRSLTNNGETESMRAKESDYDYRFMPEGNLPNLILHTDATVKNSNAKNPINVDAVKSLLPTLPQKIRENLTSKFSLDPYTIDFMLVGVYLNLCLYKDDQNVVVQSLCFRTRLFLP